MVEETPAALLPEATRQKLHQAAVELGASVNYRSAGTVEFIYDAARSLPYLPYSSYGFISVFEMATGLINERRHGDGCIGENCIFAV